MRRGRRLARLAPVAATLVISVAATLVISGLAGQTVATAASGIRCMRTDKPPAPRPGEAVIAGALGAQNEDNVVEIPLGESWEYDLGHCGRAKSAMDHPTSIQVGTGAALEFRGSTGRGIPNLTSPWGAKDQTSGEIRLSTLNNITWRKTVEVDAVTPTFLLRRWMSCRDCALANVDFTPDFNPSVVGYERDLSGADLQGATLHGSFSEWNFNQADLRGAHLSNVTFSYSEFSGTRVDRANFDGDQLVNTRLTSLRFHAPPHLTDLRVDDCVQFKDTDLRRTDISIAAINARKHLFCTRPLLEGSTAPLGLIAKIAALERQSQTQRLELDGATFVATAANRAVLAGADLSGQRFNRSRFVGFPASFVNTNFRGDQLRDTDFDGAELSGANFDNADLAGASFRRADLSEQSDAVPGATFAGGATNLTRANFIDADISGASFVGADLSSAVLSHALAEDTNFNGIRAPNAVFTGTHIYGDGRAFDSANNLRGADFNRAVLAGNIDENGGFNFTHGDLTGASFDDAQCIGCNFTGSTLDDVRFIGTYLPGAVFTDVKSMSGVQLHDAWLYCGDRSNSSCASVGNSKERWKWVLKLGTGEDYGPVPFAATNLGNAPLSEVATCPSGKRGHAPPPGCDAAQLLPPSHHAPPIPASCSAAGPEHACPTLTSTLFDGSQSGRGTGKPTALTAVRPANQIAARAEGGVYVAFEDGTIRHVVRGEHQLVAGRHDEFCHGTASCGDGGQAKDALLRHVKGLAVGIDGSLYVADAGDHRVRRIGPGGHITTVAGTGEPCGADHGRICGDGELATSAKLAGPFGVWVDPIGRIYIADGDLGVREVRTDGKIVSVGAGAFDVRSVVGAASGDLFAATDRFLLRIDPKDKQVIKVAGTDTPGYNGNRTSRGTLAPGTAVQINHPAGLSIAANGDVLFADSGNHLVRAYVPDSGHVINALAGRVVDGTPRSGFNGDGHYALETELSDPLAVAALTNGEFVVADAGNSRVRTFGPGPR